MERSSNLLVAYAESAAVALLQQRLEDGAHATGAASWGIVCAGTSDIPWPMKPG